jgi:GMP synthase-like glutamine amidotransferase
MKRVLFVQHGEVDKPGLLAEVLRDCGVECEVFHAWQGGEFPKLEEYQGLALGGGGQSSWETEDFPYLETECALVCHAMERGISVLGLCLGAQLIARALGAEVRRAESKEIGFFPVSLNAMGCSDPLINALPSVFPATHWHGDIFEIPKNGECLASSSITPHQIFRFGPRCIGFQFHLEMTPTLFEELVWDSEEFFRDAGISPEAMIQVAREVLPTIEAPAREVFRRWAAGIS